jgi:hypothetical protein
MKHDVFIDGQRLTDIQVIAIPPGSNARAIAIEAAKLIGVEPETLMVFKEDAEHPLDPDAKLDGADDPGMTHHVHQAQKVTVKINYLSDQKQRSFSPATRIQLVLDWAVGPEGFGVDASIAPEMELALSDSPAEEIPHSAHLGRYAGGKEHEVEFDLVRGIIPNGAQ